MFHFGSPGMFIGFITFMYIVIIALVVIFAFRLLRAVESIAGSLSKMADLKQRK